jgi:hypothetical protein
LREFDDALVTRSRLVCSAEAAKHLGTVSHAAVTFAFTRLSAHTSIAVLVVRASASAPHSSRQ